MPFTAGGELKELCVELTGTSVPSVVACNGESFRENILFTHRGLSGPAILQISSFWNPGDVVEIDLLPDRDALEWLQDQRSARPDAELKTVLAEVFTKKMAALLFPSKPMKQHTPAELRAIATASTPGRSRPPAPRATAPPRSPSAASTPATSPPRPWSPA